MTINLAGSSAAAGSAGLYSSAKISGQSASVDQAAKEENEKSARAPKGAPPSGGEPPEGAPPSGKTPPNGAPPSGGTPPSSQASDSSSSSSTGELSKEEQVYDADGDGVLSATEQAAMLEAKAQKQAAEAAKSNQSAQQEMDTVEISRQGIELYMKYAGQTAGTGNA